jgi:hypothetical protein
MPTQQHEKGEREDLIQLWIFVSQPTIVASVQRTRSTDTLPINARKTSGKPFAQKSEKGKETSQVVSEQLNNTNTHTHTTS